MQTSPNQTATLGNECTNNKRQHLLFPGSWDECVPRGRGFKMWRAIYIYMYISQHHYFCRFPFNHPPNAAPLAYSISTQQHRAPRPSPSDAWCVCVSAQWLAVKMMHSRCPEVVHQHKWRRGSLECDPNFFGASVPRGKRLPVPAPTHAIIYRGPHY